jgi:hypothetical protein
LVSVILVGCGGSAAGGSPAAHAPDFARQTLAVGRLPDRQGFGIFAQRYKFAGRVYIQLSSYVVPAAASAAAVRAEIDSGQFGSAEVNVSDMSAPVSLVGIVSCSRHPVVLLYGLLHPPTSSAVLVSGASRQPLARASFPADLGVHANLVYGFLTTSARLELRSGSGTLIKSESYPSPPAHRSCAGGTSSITYGLPGVPVGGTSTAR